MFSVISADPSSEDDAIYIDDPVTIIFNKEIDPSFISGDTVMMWRMTPDKESFIDRAMVNLTTGGATGNTLTITPAGTFRPLSTFVIKIMPSVAGADGETMSEAYIIYIRTSNTVRPAPSATDTDISVPPSGGIPELIPSTDLFTGTGETAPISLIKSYPSDLSVGVSEFDKITLLYNDEIDSSITIPNDSIKLRYLDLPVDADPFANRSVGVLNVTTTGHQVIIEFDEVIDATNREFILEIAGGVVRGVNRKRYDLNDHVIRFMGSLNPVYSTPDQVRHRIMETSPGTDTTIMDYGLWQAILEASVFARDVYHVVLTPETAAAINRLIICMVLRDYALHALTGRGPIKSRQLLQTAVSFYEPDIATLSKELDNCIADNLSSLGLGPTMILNGIRSESWLTRPTKWYPTTSR